MDPWFQPEHQWQRGAINEQNVFDLDWRPGWSYCRTTSRQSVLTLLVCLCRHSFIPRTGSPHSASQLGSLQSEGVSTTAPEKHTAFEKQNPSSRAICQWKLVCGTMWGCSRYLLSLSETPRDPCSVPDPQADPVHPNAAAPPKLVQEAIWAHQDAHQLQAGPPLLQTARPDPELLWSRQMLFPTSVLRGKKGA